MITLSIRYTLDASKLADFAAYAKDLQSAIERCDTAAAKRWVCVIVQLVNTPPPLPPVSSLAIAPQPAEVKPSPHNRIRCV